MLVGFRVPLYGTAVRDAMVRASFTLALLASLAACGAKSPLIVRGFREDAALDAPAPDAAPDAVDVADVLVCRDVLSDLAPHTTDVVLVVDRSASMRFTVDGVDQPVGSPNSRWQVLRDALATTLPGFGNQVALGAAFFPVPQPAMASIDIACSAGASVSVEVGAGTTDAILRVFDTTLPGGGTPTFEAIRTAANYLAAVPGNAASRFLVLATDGGPNCNRSLDGATCECTRLDTAGQSTCAMDRFGWANCLDDTRTVAEIQRTLARGIPTYVIGIDDLGRAQTVRTLDALAVAGGRARAVSPRYISVRAPADVVNAFESIRATVARCVFDAPTRPAPSADVTVELGGVIYARDTTHVRGWDWEGDATSRTLALHGDACRAADLMGSPRAQLRVHCPDR